MKRILFTLVGFLLLVGTAWACTTCSKGPAVIAFFRSNCDACLKEMPELNKLHALSDGKFKVIGVSIDEDKKLYDKFVKSKKVAYPTTRYIEWEDRGKLPIPIHVPMLYYTDKEGKLIGKGLGWFTAEYMRDQIVPLVEEKELK